MADLTPLDEKLGEVLGLAQAAQAGTKMVSTMEGAEAFQTDLDRMGEQAAETERRTDGARRRPGGRGRRRSGRRRARPRAKAMEMMDTYLAGEEEALDGFEFLSMAEAGELCHWEIVETMSRGRRRQRRQPVSPSGRSGSSASTSGRRAARPRSRLRPRRSRSRKHRRLAQNLAALIAACASAADASGKVCPTTGGCGRPPPRSSRPRSGA